MSTPTRLAGFAVVVVLGFGGGWALGAAVGPFDAEPETDHTETDHTGAGTDNPRGVENIEGVGVQGG